MTQLKLRMTVHQMKPQRVFKKKHKLGGNFCDTYNPQGLADNLHKELLQINKKQIYKINRQKAKWGLYKRRNSNSQ